jgi:hypothetical protein
MNDGLRIENQYYLRMLRVVMDAQVMPLRFALVKRGSKNLHFDVCFTPKADIERQFWSAR